VKNEVNIVQI